jgi:hypothetical protein
MGRWVMARGLQPRSRVYSMLLALSLIGRPLAFWLPHENRVDQRHETAVLAIAD